MNSCRDKQQTCWHMNKKPTESSRKCRSRSPVSWKKTEYIMMVVSLIGEGLSIQSLFPLCLWGTWQNEKYKKIIYHSWAVTLSCWYVVEFCTTASPSLLLWCKAKNILAKRAERITESADTMCCPLPFTQLWSPASLAPCTAICLGYCDPHVESKRTLQASQHWLHS